MKIKKIYNKKIEEIKKIVQLFLLLLDTTNYKLTNNKYFQ